MGTISALSVKDYGAEGDGSTDDSGAIRDCIQAALAGAGATEAEPSERPTIYFPEGVYVIHDDAVLSDWGNSDIRILGMKFVGAGMGCSSLKLKTSEGARWFWDNRGDANPRKLSMGVFQDLMFDSDQDMSESGEFTPLANGFRMWSNGYEKQWRFVNCYFQNLKEVLRTDGTGNADQVKFFGCNFWRIKDAILSTFNNQTVAMNFYGCDYHTYGDLIRVDGRGGQVTSITSTPPDDYVVTSTDHGLTTGDSVEFYNATISGVAYFVTVIDDDNFSLDGTSGGTVTTGEYTWFRAGGGGSISVNGGSVTMAEDPQDPSREKYLLNSSRPNNGAEDYCFTNLKVELYGAGTGCCVMGDWNNYLRSATFRDCNFRQIDYAENGDRRPGVVLGAHRTVTFDNCLIPPQWEYSWDSSLIPGGAEQNVSMPSLILLQNSVLVGLEDGLFDRLSGGGGSHGRLIVRNCRAFDTSGSGSASAKHAVDHDYLWFAGGVNDVSVQRKLGVLTRINEPFPRNGGNEWTLKLPQSAMILGVHAYKPPSGSSSQSYVLKIGNEDKSVVYASSDNAAHLKRQLDGSAGDVTTTISEAHEVHVNDIWRFVFADEKDQTVRMWAEHTGVTENHTLGYAIVEYI